MIISTTTSFGVVLGIFLGISTVNIRIALANTKKRNSTTAEYFTKIKALNNKMAAAGQWLDDEELVEYILTGLGEVYTSLVTTLTARVEPITVGELYSQLRDSHGPDLGGSPESRSVDAAGRGRGGFVRGGHNQRNSFTFYCQI